MSDIKSVVTGKDCPHMKEKSALKQNKVILFEVIVFYCHSSHMAVLSFILLLSLSLLFVPCCFSQEVLELAFSVLYDPDETLNFVAPNKYEVSSATVRLKAALFNINLDNGSNMCDVTFCDDSAVPLALSTILASFSLLFWFTRTIFLQLCFQQSRQLFSAPKKPTVCHLPNTKQQTNTVSN